MHTRPRDMTMPEIEEMLQRNSKKISEAPATGTDPKGEIGAQKLPLQALPWAVILEASCALGEGMIKYGPHNWRTSGGVETQTYIAAAQRHLIAFMLGEDIDPASGISHITKAIGSLMVVRDAQINGTAIDNRAPALPPGALEQIQRQWAETRVLAQKARLEMEARHNG